MDRNELHDILRSKSHDNKLSCSQCMEIAEKYDLTLKLVGETADEMDIKIVKCQLGCF